MEKCNFSNNCSVECKKYSMCAFMSIQSQLLNIQEQFNFVFKTLNTLIEDNNSVNNKIKSLDTKVMTFTEELLELYNDSEKNKESSNEEKD